jgi:hypothetical protein
VGPLGMKEATGPESSSSSPSLFSFGLWTGFRWVEKVLTPLPFSIHARSMKALKRKSASIPNSRWLAYTTAGMASAFAAANSAEGTIHYSGPINRIFKECRTASFQLDRPGDFIRLRHSSLLVCSTSFFGNAFFNVAGVAGASIAGFYDDCGHVSASNLKRGQLISSRPFLPAQPPPFGSADLAGYCPGQFLGGIGFIGFKFNNGSGDQYGWVRIQVQPGVSHQYPFKLLDYAYGDVGDTIAAGQKSGHDAPELESLGGLALGAAGLVAWRKSRSRAAR